MTDIKLIVADLDNTLLRRDKTIGDYTADVFRRLRGRGVLTAFATARPLTLVSEYSAVIKQSAMAVNNGALIFANGELIKESPLPMNEANALLRELAESGKCVKISARARDAYFTTKPRASEKSVLFDFTTPLEEPLVHLSFRTDDETFALAALGRYSGLRHFRVSGEDLYDVGAVGATKFNGIQAIAEHFGIAPADVAAFGDDWNDIEALRECGVGVAMSNAIDECKAAADYICGDCDDDGVARWIEENVL